MGNRFQPVSSPCSGMDNLVPDKLVPDKLVPDKLVPDNVVPDNLVSDNLVQLVGHQLICLFREMQDNEHRIHRP